MSAGWTATDLPDMSGTTVVVTGASSGIGLVTATRLAGVGARVVLAVRDEQRGRIAAESMAGHVEVRPLDLTSLASVRAFASTWAGDLEILINNAGIMMVPDGRTADGFELQMGTNHLGHFALTMLLLPHIRQRVVTLSSELHAGGHIDLADLAGDRRRYNALQAYRDSKLANMLFTYELSRRLPASGSTVRAMSAHPGLARTNLTGHVKGPVGFIQRVMVRMFNDAEQGALPTLYAATQPISSGSHVGPNGFRHLRGHPDVHEPSPAAQNPDAATGLWELSARLTDTVQEATTLGTRDVRKRES